MKYADWPPPTAVVKAARRGDSSSIGAICRAAQPRLRAFLRYQGFDQHSIEDTVADVTETLIAQLRFLRQARAFEAWFWTIARNQVRTRRRQQQRTEYEPASPQPTPPDELAIARDEHSQIRTALLGLDKSDRTILWLREVEGQSYREIAEIVGTQPGAARVRCHRARQRLEAAYEAAAGDRIDTQRWPSPVATWQEATAKQ